MSKIDVKTTLMEIIKKQEEINHEITKIENLLEERINLKSNDHYNVRIQHNLNESIIIDIYDMKYMVDMKVIYDLEENVFEIPKNSIIQEQDVPVIVNQILLAFYNLEN